MKKQVKKEHYNFEKYVKKSRWMSFYYQLINIYRLNPQSILEIGVGNNFLKNMLEKDYEYKSIDVADDLKPDFLGSVDNMPIKDKSFDLVVAFQILEHLPFNLFEKSLREIYRVTKRYAILSLPYCCLNFSLSIKFPFENERTACLVVPRFYKKARFNGEHYWEIGMRGFSLGKIKRILSKYFIIKKVFSPVENKHHLFFILEKKLFNKDKI